MSVEITILCPVHATEEKITVPDSYTGIAYSKEEPAIFEGDIPCAARGTERHCILHVRIRFKSATSPWIEQIIAKS